MTDADSGNKVTKPQGKCDDSKVSNRFHILRIYTTDVSFEAPSQPRILIETPSENPENRVDFKVEHNILNSDQGLTEVRLGITVTCNLGSETLYLVEVEQCGLFSILHQDADTLERALDVLCPDILLPFAREQIAGLITNGGFSPFLIAPISFEQTYQQKLKQRTEPSETNGRDPQF